MVRVDDRFWAETGLSDAALKPVRPRHYVHGCPNPSGGAESAANNATSGPPLPYLFDSPLP